MTAFVPRVTLTVAAGLAIFVVAALVYALPVLLEPPPPGAIEDWTRERVRARLAGKTIWLLAASFLVAALLSARGWIPGTGGRRRT